MLVKITNIILFYRHSFQPVNQLTALLLAEWSFYRPTWSFTVCNNKLVRVWPVPLV